MIASQQVVFLKGDMNLDVQTDLLLRSTPTGQNDVWLMNGAVRQGPPVTISPAPPSLDWQVFGADDFNADSATTWSSATPRPERSSSG